MTAFKRYVVGVDYSLVIELKLNESQCCTVKILNLKLKDKN
jgi:hypothetical protein